MKTVDVHSHFIPEKWLSYLHEKGEAEGVFLSVSPDGGEYISVKKKEGGPRTEQRVELVREQYDVSKILSDMDHEGIDVRVLSPMQFLFYYWTDPPRGEELACLINDASYDYARKNPDRFVPVAILPMQDLGRSIREMQRIVKDLGMRVIEIGTNINGMELDDRRLSDFYKKAQELGILIFVHPYDVVGMDRMQDYYLRNLAGNPFETSLAISRIILGGVLEEYPALKFLFSHGGGAIPYIMGRMDHGYFYREECKKRIKKSPSAYLKSLYFDTIVFEKRALQFLVETVGSEHVLLGSDYPFEMRELNLVPLLDSIDHISRFERDNIKGGNAARLLNL